MAGFKERNVGATKEVMGWDHSVKSSTWQIERIMNIPEERTFRAKLMFKMPAYNCNFDLKGEKTKC